MADKKKFRQFLEDTDNFQEQAEFYNIVTQFNTDVAFLAHCTTFREYSEQVEQIAYSFERLSLSFLELVTLYTSYCETVDMSVSLGEHWNRIHALLTGKELGDIVKSMVEETNNFKP